MTDKIEIRGARVNNLQNVDIDIPLNQLTCILGPSGSGKSSLAFHVLYSESKRRFLNSFPSYLKFFSDRPAPVDVDKIYPVLPVFGLPQINPVIGTRSSVVDVMHLTELLQAHFYHFAKEACPIHKTDFELQTFGHYVSELLAGKADETYHLFIKKADFLEFYENNPFPSRSMKSTRAKSVCDFESEHELWEVVRFKLKHVSQLDKKVLDYLKNGLDLYLFAPGLKKVQPLTFKTGNYRCPVKGCTEHALINKSMMNFSPYNALGACETCGGFGETLKYDDAKLVDPNKSVSEDGVILLKYKRFQGQKPELIKALKRKNISITEPIKKLKKEFWSILYEGAGNYYGIDELLNYLESKKYKMHVRIFIRNIQKGETCPSCNGTRLKAFANQFFLDEKMTYSMASLLKFSIEDMQTYLNNCELAQKTKEANKSFKKMKTIVDTAVDIGLGHLFLLRKAKSLSAGEYQRLLLLKYLSYDGTDSLFVFDEPSLGLSEQEQRSLLKAFRNLIKKGNTVILIDHNKFFHLKSDFLIQMGPLAGPLGGNVIFQGERAKFNFEKSPARLVPIKNKNPKYLTVKGVEVYGKKYSEKKVCLKQINWVKGKSGSGKTSFLIKALADELNYQLEGKRVFPGVAKISKLSGVPKFENVIIVDANLNRYTSRSTVGSMTGLFPVVRKHFLATSMAKALGLTDGHLSYNSHLGQCPKCEGKGVIVTEMQFLEDIVLECEDCNGRKLKPIYADITDGEMTVHQAFSQSLSSTLENIKLTPKFQRIRQYLKILNLDYLSLDRQINSLSGGEKQRIYLLSKLLKDIHSSILFFENISFGLSEHELARICQFLQDLCMKGNTVVIIDQNPVFKQISNYTIDF